MISNNMNVYIKEYEEFVIRTAEEKDLPQINDLYDELIHVQSDLNDMKQALKEMQNAFCNYLLVASSGEEVVGTVQCVANPSVAFGCRPFMTVEFFIVKESFRRHGAGRALMNAVEEIARQHNCNALLLISAASRTIAHQLYAQVGYDTTVKGFRKYL